MNNIIYNITNEGNTSMVINHFDFDFIINIIEDNLMRRINIYQPMLPNIISAIEQNFKILYDTEEVQGLYANEALEKRNEMYRKIIYLLCNRHNMEFIETDEIVDLYSLAYYLYDFLISNFRQYIVDFFSIYIYKEKNEIYNAFNLNDLKKSKDSSTLYGKKLYKSQKIAIINANLDLIISGISEFDISFENILNTIYTNKSIVKHILNNISINNNFFKDVYVEVLKNSYQYQTIITDIRFALHQLAYSNSQE